MRGAKCMLGKFNHRIKGFRLAGSYMYEPMILPHVRD